MSRHDLCNRGAIYDSDDTGCWCQFSPCSPRPYPPACCCVGPAGPVGVILGSYETLAELEAAHPTGNQGDMYLVGGELYVWDTQERRWKSMGNLRGPTGPAGPAGVILGSYETLAALETAHPTGNPGDMYLVDGELYVWDALERRWKSVGNLRGPSGPTEIQFSSVNFARLQSSAIGAREHVVAVGLGFEQNDSILDPIYLARPAISAKTISGGTITEIHASLSILLGSADLVASTVYVQLYAASPFSSKEFRPVAGTMTEILIPVYTPAGAIFTTSLTGLSINIEPETQLVLAFYNTSPLVTFGVDAYLGGVIKME